MAPVHGFMVCGADDEAIRLGGMVGGSDCMESVRNNLGSGKDDLGGRKRLWCEAAMFVSLLSITIIPVYILSLAVENNRRWVMTEICMSEVSAKLRRKSAAAAAVQARENEPLTYQMWQESFTDPRKRRALIQQIGERIAHEFHPEKIILFGSQAYGIPKWYSDIDLLVLLPHVEDPLEQAVTILKQLNLPVSIDLLTRTPQQLQQRLAMGDRFMQEIIERGQILSEANHA